MEENLNGLLGKFVHTYMEEDVLENFPGHRFVECQGEIVRVVFRDDYGLPDSYEVLWYSAFDDSPTDSEIISLEQMESERWSFYEDREEWRNGTNKSLELFKLDAEINMKKELLE